MRSRAEERRALDGEEDGGAKGDRNTTHPVEKGPFSQGKGPEEGTAPMFEQTQLAAAASSASACECCYVTRCSDPSPSSVTRG